MASICPSFRRRKRNRQLAVGITFSQVCDFLDKLLAHRPRSACVFDPEVQSWDIEIAMHLWRLLRRAHGGIKRRCDSQFFRERHCGPHFP